MSLAPLRDALNTLCQAFRRSDVLIVANVDPRFLAHPVDVSTAPPSRGLVLDGVAIIWPAKVMAPEPKAGCITAHTNPDPIYPGFVNFTRNDNGTVTVIVRADPKKVESEYICGFARDQGHPGRCTPGDDRCNNYCNMAPGKGPMAKAPVACTQTLCGDGAVVTLSAAAFDALIAAARP